MRSPRTRGGAGRGRLPGGDEVHLKRTLPGRGGSGCWAAIDRQIHGVLTCWGGAGEPVREETEGEVEPDIL